MSGIQLVGNTNNTTATEVEANTKAARVTVRPIDFGSNGIYSVGGTSGTMAAGLGAAAVVYSFQNGTSSPVLALVRKVIIGAGGIGAFTAGFTAFSLNVCRSFSVADSGGTGLKPTGNSSRLRTTGMVASQIGDIRIATTGALTLGTRTPDGSNLATQVSATTATAGNVVFPVFPLFEARVGEYPLVLAAQEGFEILATVPATGTWTFSVQTMWEEVSSY